MADSSHIVILGIGNLLWADRGFGVRAVEALHAGWQWPAEVELVDGGTQGWRYCRLCRRPAIC